MAKANCFSAKKFGYEKGVSILTGISLMKNARSDGGRLGPEEQLARSTSPGI